MSNEHNPIAILVSQIQQQWNEKIHPFKEYKLMRWIIKSEEARLYEGFLRLESTANGSIPEVVVALLTPFSEKKTFSKQLIAHWLEQYKEAKKKSEEEKNASFFQWDYSSFEQALEKEQGEGNQLLMQLLEAFQQSLPDKSKRLVLALMPKTMSDVNAYSDWLSDRLKEGVPEHVLFMIFDYEEERYFDDLFKRFQNTAKSLAVPLDLKGAISKLSKMGDPNSPEIQFRTCMQEMAAAVSANNFLQLEKWGTKALEITQRSGKKSFHASAHIIYAGMLFNFKKYDEINYLLDTGLKLASIGLTAGDESCKVLIIQFYAYKAACKQHSGNDGEAADLFVRQGELAMQYGFGLQTLTAWWQAYTLYQKSDQKTYTTLLEKTYQHGSTLSKEELTSSCIGYIAFDYYEYLKNLKQTDACEQVNNFMKGIDGEEWRQQVEKYKNDTKHKKRFLVI